MKYIEMRRNLGSIPPPNHWLFWVSTRRQPWDLEDAPNVDPQRGWYELNQNILQFLETIPQHQKMLVRGEDLLTDLDGVLTSIAQWLDIRTDSAAIESCTHTELTLSSRPRALARAEGQFSNNLLSIGLLNLRLDLAKWASFVLDAVAREVSREVRRGPRQEEPMG